MVVEERAQITDGKETGRIEAFSDGVFAIAMTLLVLDIKVPRMEDLGERTSLLSALAHQWPIYLAYITSFVTILIMWVNHHQMMRQIARTDHTFLLLNGLLLLAVSVIPFPTSLLAEYIQHRDAKTAAVIYSGAFLLIALFFNAMWRYAAHGGRLLARDADRQFVADTNRQFRFGPILYLIPAILALISAVVSFGFILLLAIYWGLPTTVRLIFHPGTWRVGRRGNA